MFRAIKNLKVSLEVVEQLKFPDENIVLIINRANTKVGITTDEIESTLKRKIDISYSKRQAGTAHNKPGQSYYKRLSKISCKQKY